MVPIQVIVMIRQNGFTTSVKNQGFAFPDKEMSVSALYAGYVQPFTSCMDVYRLSFYAFYCFCAVFLQAVLLSVSTNSIQRPYILVCQFDIYFCCLFSFLISFYDFFWSLNFFDPWAFVSHIHLSDFLGLFMIVLQHFKGIISVSCRLSVKPSKLNLTRWMFFIIYGSLLVSLSRLTWVILIVTLRLRSHLTLEYISTCLSSDHLWPCISFPPNMQINTMRRVRRQTGSTQSLEDSWRRASWVPSTSEAALNLLLERSHWIYARSTTWSVRVWGVHLCFSSTSDVVVLVKSLKFYFNQF